MLEELKERVCAANLRLVREGLVILTWGNASGISRRDGVMVIKPSGVPYEQLRPEHMVVVSVETGEVVEGTLRPSSDTPTHLELYRAFPQIGGIVHTHSLYATIWAQAGREIPPLGTTHADYFHGPIPCTRPLTPEEIATDYEAYTGRVIVERFAGLDPRHMPAVLVAGHAPFVWGETVEAAVEVAIVLEYVAHMALETLRLNPSSEPISEPLLDKHFFRKHGPGAYYGQMK
ncbi:MAG: L-ribulose-5-phosphate 4-epimerase [Blastocatellia bacterium]|nr:L-ribulose-5-phosphate 4-epimerase [Blastocatellia bacterium]MCS7157216.1 L-ribulose-5-phosphate 4-epimerase [Blastocatellia bacterium]MCX7752321.1 L-ribulose-5-phosphate 4-epimerase [Blastocatellia bacterium]MDW8167202.1 L-ribulose-5-phosphate 4-epimerase [Acidobacteriota bacterium]